MLYRTRSDSRFELRDWLHFPALLITVFRDDRKTSILLRMHAHWNIGLGDEIHESLFETDLDLLSKWCLRSSLTCMSNETHNLVLSWLWGTRSFSRPSLVSLPMAVLFREVLWTKTCVYPPTAAGVSLSISKTPTSYVTELLPSLLTLRPRSTTWGKERGAKNLDAIQIRTRPKDGKSLTPSLTSQYEETTRPMRGEVEGSRPQCWMRYVLTIESKRW